MLETDICNLAIGYIGIEKKLTDFATDTTPTAKACRSCFDSFYETLLKSYPWTFSAKVSDLAQVDSNTQGYQYAYSLPNDFLEGRALGTSTDETGFLLQYYSATFLRDIPMRLQNIYKISLNDVGDHRILLTNVENARLLYTSKPVVSVCTSEFCEALSARVASYLAMAIPHNATLAKTMLDNYKDMATNATMLDGNGQNEPYNDITESASIRIC